jgi:formiminotetrahydrofolate cyclodeaminase
MPLLWEKPLEEFRDELASASPAPGGGAVGAVTCAFGTALVIMACEIAAPKENASREIAGSLPQLRNALAGLSAAAEKDAEAYQAYSDAYALPRMTPDETAARDAALTAALLGAADAPVAAIEIALAAIEIAERVAPLVHAGILSDVAGGAALLEGGTNALLFTLDSNLRLMRHAEQKEQYAAKRRLLTERLSGPLARIREIAAERLA